MTCCYGMMREGNQHSEDCPNGPPTLIVASGSRDLTYDQFQKVLQHPHMVWLEDVLKHPRSMLYVGDCRGADNHLRVLANTFRCHVSRFEADWQKYGSRAGTKRNEQMVAEAHLKATRDKMRLRGLVIVHHPMSSRSGSVHALRMMDQHDIETTIVRYDRKSGRVNIGLSRP